MEYITDVMVIEGKHATISAPAGYVTIPLDVNKGAGGRFIYICYKRERGKSG